MERRFHSPYRYWLQGFGLELAAFGAFLAMLLALSALFAWLA